MNKQEILEDYKNQEERLLVAKVLDKLEFIKTKNKIESTDFLNLYEQELVQKLLQRLHFENYYFFGGSEISERKVAIFYPEKLTKEMCEKNHKNIMSIIRIELPKELEDEYNHSTYLGAIMKLGLEREKVGDIFAKTTSADIIVKNEIVKFLMQNLSSLTRFEKSQIEEKNIEELSNTEVNKIEMSAIVASLRLDNIVTVLAKTSRSKAVDIIDQERVFVNFKLETKASKQVNEGDVITIRGKGRFEFKEISGNTKKGRYVIKIDKYL